MNMRVLYIDTRIFFLTFLSWSIDKSKKPERIEDSYVWELIGTSDKQLASSSK